jgi:hypothetical protein
VIAEKEIPMYLSSSFRRMPARKLQTKKVKPAKIKNTSSYKALSGSV